MGASSASDCVALQDGPVKGAPSGRVAEAMAQSAPLDGSDSKGLNQWERTALELAEERPGMARSVSVPAPPAPSGRQGTAAKYSNRGVHLG
jgi:hypothetical protein